MRKTFIKLDQILTSATSATDFCSEAGRLYGEVGVIRAKVSSPQRFSDREPTCTDTRGLQKDICKYNA